jgi:hypothetical protein
VQVDALALRLRPRTPLEAADLGVRLCQRVARSIYLCYAMVALPVIAVALSTSAIASWMPTTMIWCAKPWFDRTILFVLSRAAFGQATTAQDLLRARKHVWWNQLLFTLTIRRLSPWRSLTQPVYQLEGLSPWAARTRVRQIRRRGAGSALMMTSAFGLAETAIWFSVLSLVFWLAPSGYQPDLTDWLSGEPSQFVTRVFAGAYAMAVLFLEPFYVASGFAMYLNRRAELEAWDIEQEFRRAFAQ